MGSPELPEPCDDNLQIHVPLGIIDDNNSDNETMDAYNGYQPLPMMDDNMDVTRSFDDYEQEDNIASQNSVSVSDNDMIDAQQEDAEQVTHGDPNLPTIETADSEISRQVWSEPRPQELQIELDTTRTTQILNAMANFQLPNVAVPEWAAGVPEERWKEELLQRIRQRKEPQIKTGTSLNNSEHK